MWVTKTSKVGSPFELVKNLCMCHVTLNHLCHWLPLWWIRAWTERNLEQHRYQMHVRGRCFPQRTFPTKWAFVQQQRLSSSGPLDVVVKPRVVVFSFSFYEVACIGNVFNLE